MGNCKNCKFWDRNYRVGECNRVDMDSTFEIVVRVADDYGLNVGLKVGPNFGCVYFLQKGKAKQ